MQEREKEREHLANFSNYIFLAALRPLTRLKEEKRLEAFGEVAHCLHARGEHALLPGLLGALKHTYASPSSLRQLPAFFSRFFPAGEEPAVLRFCHPRGRNERMIEPRLVAGYDGLLFFVYY